MLSGMDLKLHVFLMSASCSPFYPGEHALSTCWIGDLSHLHNRSRCRGKGEIYILVGSQRRGFLKRPTWPIIFPVCNIFIYLNGNKWSNMKYPCSSAVKRTQSHTLVWPYMFGFALCVPCLLYVLCFVLFTLCVVSPCLYQCKIYCHRENTKLQ
jgi:hypothetical protein